MEDEELLDEETSALVPGLMTQRKSSCDVMVFSHCCFFDHFP
jgi:hypothetical protein